MVLLVLLTQECRQSLTLKLDLCKHVVFLLIDQKRESGSIARILFCTSHFLKVTKEERIVKNQER